MLIKFLKHSDLDESDEEDEDFTSTHYYQNDGAGNNDTLCGIVTSFSEAKIKYDTPAKKMTCSKCLAHAKFILEQVKVMKKYLPK
jgi:hypothetical protein